MLTLDQSLDLTNPENIAILRETHLAPASAKKDYPSAIKVLGAILQAQPDRIRERSEIASFYTRMGIEKEAETQILIAMEKAPQDQALRAQALQIFLSFSQVEKAATLAAALAPDELTEPRLADLSMTALYRAKALEDASAFALASATLNAENLAALTRAAAVLTTAGKASNARKILSDAGAAESEDAQALFELGRAAFSLNKQSPEALAALQKAASLAPENARIADFHLRALLANGKNKAAVEAVQKSGISTKNSASYRLQYARALRATKRYGEAADVLSALSEADPQNSVLRRQCAGALAIAGRGHEASELYQNDIAQRKTALPASFKAGLEAISSRLDDAKIPQERFDWAYSQLQKLGSAPKDRAAWEDRVRWINLADHLLLNWTECNPAEATQVLEIIDGEKEVAAKINSLMPLNQGAFIVTAHIGALFAGPAALVSSGLDPIWVASTPVTGTGPEVGRILSTSSMDDLGVARAIMAEINAARIVTIAIDGASVPNLPRFPLFDRQIGLSDFVPRTCYRTGIRAFFPVLLWENGRIKTDVVPLPLPEKGEARDAYVSRWLGSFTSNITNIFANSPDNLRMTGGFWSGLSS